MTLESVRTVPFNGLNRRLRDQAGLATTLLTQVLERGQLLLGPETAALEAALASWVGVSHAIAVANGSDALELALRAVGIGPGDGVICAANAGGYARFACNQVGAHAQYAEISDDRPTLDPQAVAARIDHTTRAIVLTHLYGQVGPADALRALADAKGLALIEDCAQAHGARLGDRMVGSFGDVATLSFYPTKNLGALGDAGALLTRDATLAERLRALRQYGWKGKYEVAVDSGRNSRIDEFQAAWLNHQLRGLDAENAERWAIAERYQSALADLQCLRLPDWRPGDVVHLYVVACAQRDALRTHLASRGVESAVHYPTPDHRQPAWTDPGLVLPNTERQASEALSLPCFPGLRPEEQQRVIDALRSWQP